MARTSELPLQPALGFHPYRAVFSLPFTIFPDGCWTEDRPGAESGHPGVDALMRLPGVAIVSLQADRLTLIRDPGTAWESILGPAQELLRTHFLSKPAVFVPA
ncbi:MAG: hypothetical protein ISR76_01185 [Planctomycetes bacterium]|nr:hypothetical protein [Planctomycetota bacterium]MBL7007582.1 hypothetical protein [Planctomycetota bacterium]